MGLMYLISYGRAESKSVALWALSHAVAGNGVFIETFFFFALSLTLQISTKSNIRDATRSIQDATYWNDREV